MRNRQKEIIDQLSDKELLVNFYISQLLIFGAGFISARFLLGDWFYALRLFNWKSKEILTIGLTAALFVLTVDLLFMKFFPPTLYDDGGINERLFSNRNPVHIIAMAAFVSIGEELLFRGVLQTTFGLAIASILFALVHYRYLFNKFLFVNIVIVSFFLGIVFQYTGNLAVTVFMHFLIDCVLGFVYAFRKKKGQSR